MIDGVAPRVLRRVLDRLERCEVDRRLDRLRIARKTVDPQCRPGVASNRLRERGAQAEVGQNRWIGAVGDLTDLVERPVDLLAQARQLRVGSAGFRRQVLAQALEVHPDHDQPLLSAVVQVALDPAALVVRELRHAARLGALAKLRLRGAACGGSA